LLQLRRWRLKLTTVDGAAREVEDTLAKISCPVSDMLPAQERPRFRSHKKGIMQRDCQQAMRF
jgi:hypothetical protein